MLPLLEISWSVIQFLSLRPSGFSDMVCSQTLKQFVSEMLGTVSIMTYLVKTLDHTRGRIPCGGSRNRSRRSRCRATDEVAVNAGLRQRAHCEGRDGQKRVGSDHDESKTSD